MQQPVDNTDLTHQAWLVFIYRTPSEPSSSRVAIWRDLKRIGAYYLQQCACILPDRPHLREELDAARRRLERLGGTGNLFCSPPLPAAEQQELIESFRGLAAQQYAEIVEECETKFVKEVEFEHFRRNYSFAEAEEIEQDLEKIRRWYARVQERDWFAAPGRDEVEVWIARCAELLDGFFAAVHSHTRAEDGAPSDGRSVPRPPSAPHHPAPPRPRHHSPRERAPRGDMHGPPAPGR